MSRYGRVQGIKILNSIIAQKEVINQVEKYVRERKLMDLEKLEHKSNTQLDLSQQDIINRTLLQKPIKTLEIKNPTRSDKDYFLGGVAVMQITSGVTLGAFFSAGIIPALVSLPLAFFFSKYFINRKNHKKSKLPFKIIEIEQNLSNLPSSVHNELTNWYLKDMITKEGNLQFIRGVAEPTAFFQNTDEITKTKEFYITLNGTAGEILVKYTVQYGRLGGISKTTVSVYRKDPEYLLLEEFNNSLKELESL